MCSLTVWGHFVSGCHTTGFYGYNCSIPCPDLNCRYCHLLSGACRGCTPGYKGHHCELGILFIFTRNCYPHWTALWKHFKLVIYLWTECGDGHFGEGCQSKCGHCADISQCHHEDGTCLNGCKAGYMGAYCKKGKVISFLINTFQIWNVYSHSRMFYSYGDVTIIC